MPVRLARLARLVPIALCIAVPAFAADAGAPAPAPSASVRPATAPHADGGPAEAPTEPSPHGHARANSDMFEAPEDSANDDPSLPAGTLDIHIVDALGRPQPHAAVTLGVLYNSISKGDSKKRLSLTTNEQGVARIEHLESGSGVAYRPMVLTEGATFSAMPFRMPDATGMRAILHVYPVVSDIEDALVAAQSIVYAEVKDDRVQVQEAYKIYNFGKVAWVPRDLVIPLPEEFTAFSTQQGMSDIGVEAVPKKGVRVHGTFVPGQHVIEFRWQLPYNGERNVSFDVGMPPRIAAARVIAPASREMKLEVPGFPPPQSSTDGQGQRSLVTERQLRKDDPPLKSVSVSITGLPSDGARNLWGTGLAAAIVLAGLVLGTRRPARLHDLEALRQGYLRDLEDLEHARQQADIGPKTYEKERRRLLDALAQTFALEEKVPLVAARPRRRRPA